MNRREKRELKKNIKPLESVLRIIKQYIPRLIPMLNELTDKRHKSYVKYEMGVIMVVRILAYLCGVKSMRGISDTFNTEETIENIGKILGINIYELPHYDTINDVIKEIEVNEIKNIIKYIIKALIRSKMFDRYRIRNKYFQIVVDGTGINSFNTKHCEHCLVKKYTDKETGEINKIYYHYVLEAKIVVGNIVISIDSEFVENEKEDVEKQDCELNAFYRMAKRIKENYPRLPILISGDALYACKPVMRICIENKWQYILRFKSGRIRSLSEEIEGLEKAENDDKYVRYWNELKYGHILDEGQVNVLKYYEKDNDKTTEFTWIVSFNVTEKNKEELIYAGRQRWKIENEGFNEQKNLTFDITHILSINNNAIKVHYLLIQIAHIIRQLLEKGISVIKELKATKKEVSYLLTKELTTLKYNLNVLEKIQLRFD